MMRHVSLFVLDMAVTFHLPFPNSCLTFVLGCGGGNSHALLCSHKFKIC